MTKGQIAALTGLSIAVGAVTGEVVRANFALARAVNFDGAKAQLQLVELRPGADGGADLTVYARVEGDGDAGVAIDRARTCPASSLTAPQRACLATLRSASLQCWKDEEAL